MGKHIEEKPFRFAKCGKSFSKLNDLKEHDRKHIGEKPFKCTRCDKSLLQSSYLKTHES